jgi:RNA recognition motif. (a.k.a. RRM, RBD, or RNP domain)
MCPHCSDGHSRQFGFVGFKSAEDAQAALDYFNNSYLDTGRLNIQVSCRGQLARSAITSPQPYILLLTAVEDAYHASCCPAVCIPAGR